MKDRQRVIQERLQQKLRKASATSTIPRRPDPESFPLSFTQERLWFLDQLEPNIPIYNRPLALQLTGLLDIQILEQALNDILRRHEVLRAKFSHVDGQPVQHILPAWTIKISKQSLNNVSLVEREEGIQHILQEEAQKPFTLSEGPLIRATLLQLKQESHILLIIFHHIVFDGWSAEILIKELSACYHTFRTGESSPLDELPIQYADFAAWQKHRLQDRRLETLLTYWKRQLAGAPPELNLPSDHPRPATPTYQGGSYTFILSSKLLQGLNTLSQQENVTLFMTLLAAFNVLLYRYTAQEDMVIGVPVAGRTQVETEELIGCFVNTLPLRNDLSGNPSFRELLQRVRTMTLEAYAHQELPFEKLVEELRPERRLGRSPIFQVLFNLENIPEHPRQCLDLSIKEFEFDNGTAPLDLILELIKKGSELACVFTYNTDIFERATIERMTGSFQRLLEGLVKNSEQPISLLSLLTETEQHQILVEWNDTKTEYSRDACIHHLFEGQVKRSPHTVAAVFEDQQLTYDELNARANQLAWYLRKLGVGPEVLVGICVERSLDMVVGLLGILKAGGAYVPLSPAYPKDRLAFMLEDAQIPLLVTQKRWGDMFSEREGQVVCLDHDGSMIYQESRGNPMSDVTSDNLAYVMYTSGTTGQPKGVITHHRGFCNIITASIKNFYFQPNSRILQHISSSFDGSIWEIFMALLAGTTLCLASKPGMLSGTDLRQELHKQAITVAVLIPSVLATLPKETFSTLHTLIVGAESCSPDLVNQWSPHRHFFNTYGPTEASINVSFIECTGRYNQQPPIGRPTANMQIYLLDQQQQLVPVGVSGDLYIGGIGLARGYLNRPDLTAERFIPHPFSDTSGERLYTTGDLARYLPNGNIEFLGRVDHQVKIRGFRIELGEIEAVLAQHLVVREVVVLAQEESPDTKRLVAYVVSAQPPGPSIEELRQFLTQKLPEYMVPSAFVFLDTLPLTPNGKVDRKALPVPDQSRPDLETPFMAPRTPIEEIIASIWANVLDVRQVGISDNFFALGGHSLLATQIIFRMRSALKMEFPLQTIFETPTVAGLARGIESLQRTLSRSSENTNTFNNDEEWNEL